MRDLTSMPGRIDGRNGYPAALTPSGEGMFEFERPGRPGRLRVIACIGDGWDHVSVSRRNRVPSWEDMEFVKRRFFLRSEVAMQLHVPPTDHISCHPYCLHLWRPNDGREIPRPPADMVA